MATLTIPQKISIAKINEYLISSAILKGNRVIDIELPTKIRIIREGIEYRYNIDPSDDTLTSTSNYMLGMCLYISAAVLDSELIYIPKLPPPNVGQLKDCVLLPEFMLFDIFNVLPAVSVCCHVGVLPPPPLK